jgi:hypothetical protein
LDLVFKSNEIAYSDISILCFGRHWANLFLNGREPLVFNPMVAMLLLVSSTQLLAAQIYRAIEGRSIPVNI